MIDWQKTAWLFPGQASQSVGMGADVVHAFPEARAVYEKGDAVLDFELSRLCWEGPEEALNDTINTQPALYVTSLAILQVLRVRLQAPLPAYVAGHSLGEITALAAADALSFEAGLHLVRERGRLMKEAGETTPGSMAAVIGVNDVQLIEQACKQARLTTGEPVILANDNCPGQMVISGSQAAIERAIALLDEAGAKKIVPLAVSIASHSPLMEEAANTLAHYLQGLQFRKPKTPVIGNVTAAPLINAENIRVELAAQLTSRVRWAESMRMLRAGGIETFIEVGPGAVLTGLMKRIDRKARRVALNSAEALEAFVAEHAP